MNEEFQDYIAPVLTSIRSHLYAITSRADRRPVSEWKENDFRMASADADSLAKDCMWIVDALNIYRDVKLGVFDAKDREGGTPG